MKCPFIAAGPRIDPVGTTLVADSPAQRNMMGVRYDRIHA